MGYLEGILGGFMDRKYAVEQQNLDEANKAADRESRVYGALLMSPDPEVQAHALTGLLTSAQAPKRAGGIRGWLGQIQANPAYEQIKRLIATPTTALEPMPGATPTAPSHPSTGMIGMPPSQSLAQSPTAATTPGAPPLTATEPAPAPSTVAAPEPTAPERGAAPAAAAGTFAGGQRTVLRPRHVLMSPEEGMLMQRRAAAQGDVEGFATGLRTAFPRMPEDQVQTLAQRHFMRGAGMGVGSVQSIAGELPDGTPAFGVFDRLPGSPTFGKYIDPDTHQPLEGFRPRTTTGSTTLGVDRETFARILYSKRASQLTGQQLATVEEAARLTKQQLTPNQALGHAERMLPDATKEQQLQFADALRSGTAAPSAVAPSVAQPPSEVVPPGLTPAEPSPGATPPPAPAHPGMGAAVPPELSRATREMGKPLPPAIQTAIARTLSMNDTLDKALAALEPYKTDDRLQSSIDIFRKYRLGTESNPIAIDEAQLGDLAGLQQAASASLGGAGRSQRIYADKRLHTPRAPSGRQIMAAGSGLGAEATQRLSLLRGDEGGFDAPSQMYLKLKNLRDLNLQFIADMTEASALTKPSAPIRPMSSHGPGAAPTVPTAHKDANGNWVISIP